MKFPAPLLHGTLVKRYRRFLMDARLPDGSTITAHCSNSGTMRGCNEPGRPVVISDSQNRSRKNPLTWELINVNDTWVCVNPLIARKAVLEALENRTLPSLLPYTQMERNAVYGAAGNKIDVILYGMERNCFINIYMVTWTEKGIALFPDMPSPRAVKSVTQLADIAREGHSSVVFFFILRNDCTVLKPAEQVDRGFLKAMLAAQGAGAHILAHQADITTTDINLGKQIQYSAG
jgi:sugar fermentation stimulation protein A